MSKIIKELNIKLIIPQCLALIFIISGINRLYVGFHGEQFDALMNKDWEKYESLANYSIEFFLLYKTYWTITSIAIGILMITLIDWRYKFGIVNSLVVIIITFAISASGFYSSGLINRYLNFFCGLFSEGYGMAFLIGGLIILLIGITILWISVNLNKNTVHNKAYN
ncbi:hypothetical protein ACOSP6_00190 [Tenacibaculum sp. MEBiC06402]|uniref:hypothetical protein n=1 Tax=unclassified Tenacibaculum TaxID=2635139 RepID=UPI003B9D271A